MYWYGLIFHVLLIHPSESLLQNVGDVVGLGALTQNGEESVKINLCHTTAKMSRMNMNKDHLRSTIWETWSFLFETWNLHANKGLSLKGLEMPWEAPQHCMEEETCVNVMMETTRTDKGRLDARTDRKAIHFGANQDQESAHWFWLAWSESIGMTPSKFASMRFYSKWVKW
jgi:hypothetical protein